MSGRRQFVGRSRGHPGRLFSHGCRREISCAPSAARLGPPRAFAQSNYYPEQVWLDKWHRNAIFNAITAVGLDPRDFELENDGDGDGDDARISHRSSESTFVLGRDASGGYSGTRVVGEALAWPYKVYSWSAVEERFASWLGELKRDLETPDLWAELRQERKMLDVAAGEAAENTPFSPDEQREITKQLREITEYVKQTNALSEDEVQALEERLDYLEEAAGRLGRLDWRTVVAGTLLTAIVGAVLPPEATRDILLMLLRSLAHLFGHPFPELSSGY
jgi:hypothetical protein